MVVTALGKDQLLWLSKYMTINLNHWRLISIGQTPEWIFVGEWVAGETRTQCDRAYLSRQRNLTLNRYFYWPNDTISL